MLLLNNRWVQAGVIFFLFSLFSAGALGLFMALTILIPAIREKLGLNQFIKPGNEKNNEPPKNEPLRATNGSTEVRTKDGDSEQDPYRFHVKTEPSGEISCSKASDSDASKIIRSWLAENVDIYEMQELAREWSVCGLNGIFSTGGETDFSDEPSRIFGEKHELPKDSNGDYEPGIYVILSALTKASLEIDIPALNADNVKELKLSYQSFDFPAQHSLYGKLKATVLTGIEFRNEYFDHSEIVDRGYDLVTHIVFATGKKCSVIATFKNDEELENSSNGNDIAMTCIALAEYSLSTLKDRQLSAALHSRANDAVDQHQITNELVLRSMHKLSATIEEANSSSQVAQAEVHPSNGAEANASNANLSHFVIAVGASGSIFSRTTDAYDSGGNVDALRQAALDASTEMVNEIAYRFDGFIDCLAASDADDSDNALSPYEQAIESGAFDSDFENFYLLLRFKSAHDSDRINQEFLAMDEWNFYAHWIDEQDQVRTQGYSSGEFDTGYFAAIEWGDDETEYLDNGPTNVSLRMAAMWTGNLRDGSSSQKVQLQSGGSTSSTLDLVLVEIGDQKVSLIKAIRKITGLGLREAKGIVDNVEDGVPTLIITGLSAEDAKVARGKIEKLGGKTKISEGAG
jgi:ribosomal protein L7/L12